MWRFLRRCAWGCTKLGGKMWALLVFFIIASQLRYQGTTLEARFHSYITRPEHEKFFAQVLWPLHWSLLKVGYPAGENEIQRALAYVPPVDPEKIKPGLLSPENMRKLKENIEERNKTYQDLENEFGETDPKN